MTFIKHSFLSLATIALCLLVLASCATNPTTGNKMFTGFMNEQQEMAAGQQLFEKMYKEAPMIEDPELGAYLRSIAERIVPFSERDLTYHIHIQDTPVINAFATPGGYLYFTRGLLTMADNEAQVAAIFAHEMAHVTAYHGAQKVSHGTLTGLGINLLGMAASAAGVPNVSGITTASDIAGTLYMKSHSREMEYEADKLAVRYLAQAGYPPHAMADFLRKLGWNKEVRKSLDPSLTEPIPFLSTHPSSPKRVARAKALADQVMAEFPQLAKHIKETNAYGRERHLRAINGMTYGESYPYGRIINPAEAKVVFDANKKPKYNLALLFDANIEMRLPTFLKAETVTPDNPHDPIYGLNGRSIKDHTTLFVRVQPKSAATARSPMHYLRTQWLMGVAPMTEQETVINTMPAAAITYTEQGQGGVYNVVATVVDTGSHWLRLSWITHPDKTVKRAKDWRFIRTYLRPMDARNRGKFGPLRMDIIPAPKGKNWVQLAEDYMALDEKEARLPMMKLLNGQQNQAPTAYTPIKTVACQDGTSTTCLLPIGSFFEELIEDVQDFKDVQNIGKWDGAFD